jgi:hypothetical protein
MAQKRSENTYQKINTIFMRDAKNVIMPYEAFTEPEFEYLRSLKWRGEEKIDGTNMRIEVTKEVVPSETSITPRCAGVKFNVRFAGKTDNAQIPPKLLKHMEEKYPKEKVLASLGLKEFIPVEEWEIDHNWLEYDQIPNIYTIYGEGYGEGIQSGGWYIKGGNEFIVFDVKVNDIYLKAKEDAGAKTYEKVALDLKNLLISLDDDSIFQEEGYTLSFGSSNDSIAKIIRKTMKKEGDVFKKIDFVIFLMFSPLK